MIQKILLIVDIFQLCSEGKDVGKFSFRAKLLNLHIAVLL